MMPRTFKHGVPEAVHLTEQNFDEALIANEGLVMVDFWAEWCGPSRAIAPVLEELAAASEGRVALMKVNVDENHGLAARYGIESIPTILFFKQGAVVDRVLGAAPRAVLQSVENARDPAGPEQGVILRNGACVRVRAIRPDDESRLMALRRRLSSHTLYQR